MTQLSPAAQAILIAFLRAPCDNRLAVAATLRAAADQALPPPQKHWPHYELGVARDRLLGIAAELEGSSGKDFDG